MHQTTRERRPLLRAPGRHLATALVLAIAVVALGGCGSSSGGGSDSGSSSSSTASQEPPAFTGHRWVLDTAASTPHGAGKSGQLWVEFADDGSVIANNGCGGTNGTYDRKGTAIRIRKTGYATVGGCLRADDTPTPDEVFFSVTTADLSTPGQLVLAGPEGVRLVYRAGAAEN